MIGYAFIGSNDLETSLAFWDQVSESLGGKRLMKIPPDRGWFYGSGKGAMLAVSKPYDGEGAACGNGNMIALACDDTDAVDAAHKVALDAGATDDGAPGWRIENVFYGAYFRDPCGNKICVYKMNMG
ncbi:MAG: VOC family protein [Pacificimonas sp.]|jgi:catechol 2,3-dioxygenase-like lactoylglutathione lyase family enzyme|nr:VOC family protein [Pacificimonas sp.]